MRIGITGSSGFMGNVLLRELTAAGETIFPYSLETSFDVENWDLVKTIPEVDVIVHLAARSFVPDSFKFPNQYINTNLRTTANMLELARMHGSAMIFISSYVYGTPKFLPITEEHPLEAHNPYAFSKIMGEQLCRYYYDEFHVPVTVLRPFNVYGPNQRGDFLIPTMLKQIDGGKIILKDPRPRRDFIYIDDVARAMAAVIQSKRKTFDIFNIGSGESYSIGELANVMKRISNRDVVVEFLGEERPNEVIETVADISKITSAVGWKPLIDIQEGLKRCYLHTHKALK